MAMALILVFTGLTAQAFEFSILDHQKIDFFEEETRCLDEIINSDFTKMTFPGLVRDKHNEAYYQALKQIDQFCGCTLRKRREEIQLKSKDKIAYRFLNKKNRLEHEDQCAMAHFSDKMLPVYYLIVVSTRIRDDLINRLEDGRPSDIRHFASQSSLTRHDECLQSEILRRCTRIKSLRNTYSCIQELTTSPKEMDLLKAVCPKLTTPENDTLFLTESMETI